MLPDELLNKYNVLQLLHHGIGGDVWLVEHKHLGGKRVLKTIEKSHPQYSTLVKEAKILQQCQHSSIPIIYDILEFDTQTFIVEEFIQGENLKQHIVRQRRISASLLLDISRQLCDILLFLHNPARQILHLDIKPENILFSNHKLKLIDFGSAICQRQNDGGPVFGTPAYCAPEMQTMGNLTERTDIYCMGKCMEYLLFHTVDAPKGYREIVNRCLRKTDREYEAVWQIRKDLDRVSCKKKKERKRERWYAVTGVLTEHDSSMTALQLAMYLRDRYHKPVLYLDCTEERIMEHYPILPEQKNELDGDYRSFTFEQNQITVVKRVALQEISGWRNKGYALVVVCMGTRSPLLSDCPFEICLFSGALTELCITQWKTMLVPVTGVYRVAAALTGGNASLATKEFDRRCRIKKLPAYFEAFGPSKPFKRQMKYLLNKM